MKKMQPPLRVGTVGTSRIMRIIQDAMRHTDGWKCSVIYSRDLERAKAFAREMEEAGSGPLGTCSDLDELAGRSDVDVVYLASPNILHYEQALRVMRAGKPVIIEKPVACAQWKMEELKRTAAEHDVMFLEAISTLFMPNFLKLKSEIMPKLGKIKEAVVAYGRYSSQYDAYKRGENPNVFNPAMEGGALNDMGIYCIHIALALFGEPERVSCDRALGPDGADLDDELDLYYPDLTVHVRTSKSRNIENGLWITGENGTFAFEGEAHDFGNGGAAKIGDEQIILNEQGNENRMVYEQAAMAACLANADTAFFERMYAQTKASVRILEEAHACARIIMDGQGGTAG